MASCVKIGVITVFAMMLAAASAYAGVVPQGEPGIGTGVLFKPVEVKSATIEPAEEPPAEVHPSEQASGIITDLSSEKKEIEKICDPMAYFTRAEWPGIKILKPYELLPPGGYEKEVWDGEFNPEESVTLSIEDPTQCDGDPRSASLKVERFVPGLELQTQQEQREELYCIEKKPGAKLIINCLLTITVKRVSPGMSAGTNFTTAFAPQPCQGENCYMDLDVRYESTGKKVLYEIHTETGEFEEPDYIDLVSGSNAAYPYRMTLDGVTVKGCNYWGRFGGAFEQGKNPGNATSTYCGGYYGGEPGDEDFIVEISLTNMANQDLLELKFRQSDFSSTPVIDGSPIYFGSVYLAQSKAVGKLEGFGKIKSTGKLNKYGFFFFNAARGAYVRYYPGKPYRIILRGFVWYANPTDVDDQYGMTPPGFFRNSYVFFRGERIPLSSHGWNTDFDGSDVSKRVHNIYYNFWLDKKLNITFDYWKGSTFKIKSKWRVIADVIPGPYKSPY